MTALKVSEWKHSNACSSGPGEDKRTLWLLLVGFALNASRRVVPTPPLVNRAKPLSDGVAVGLWAIRK